MKQSTIILLFLCCNFINIQGEFNLGSEIKKGFHKAGKEISHGAHQAAHATDHAFKDFGHKVNDSVINPAGDALEDFGGQVNKTIINPTKKRAKVIVKNVITESEKLFSDIRSGKLVQDIERGIHKSKLLNSIVDELGREGKKFLSDVRKEINLAIEDSKKELGYLIDKDAKDLYMQTMQLANQIPKGTLRKLIVEGDPREWKKLGLELAHYTQQYVVGTAIDVGIEAALVTLDGVAAGLDAGFDEVPIIGNVMQSTVGVLDDTIDAAKDNPEYYAQLRQGKAGAWRRLNKDIRKNMRDEAIELTIQASIALVTAAVVAVVTVSTEGTAAPIAAGILVPAISQGMREAIERGLKRSQQDQHDDHHDQQKTQPSSSPSQSGSSSQGGTSGASQLISLTPISQKDAAKLLGSKPDVGSVFINDNKLYHVVR
jgi:hypothetical protein